MSFNGEPGDLYEKIEYEYQTLEFLRHALFKESTTTDSISITLGEITGEGRQIRTHNMAIVESISAEAVSDALSQMRPLAFSAAYKLHDMLAEWILEANPGYNSRSMWKFKEKIDFRDRLIAERRFIQPALFETRQAISEAFWGLYKSLVKYRNTLTHAGGASVGPAGELRIVRPSGAPLNMSADQQGAYARALCLIAKSLARGVDLDAYTEAQIETDLFSLSTHHNSRTLRKRVLCTTTLEINVPSAFYRRNPTSVEIDWAEMRSMLQSSLGPQGDVEVFFSATVILLEDEAAVRWVLPFYAIPVGKVVIAVGDPRFDPYLQRP